MNDSALYDLYKSWSGTEPESVSALPASGSSRKYFRFTNKDHSVIGAINPDQKENEAFIYLSSHFRKLNLPVPEVLAQDLHKGIYLVTDLGDETLFQFLTSHRISAGEIDPETIHLYQKSLENLAGFQIRGAGGLDFTICYPRSAFDRQSMMWDLNYFKYYFIKLTNIQFNEQLLEDDFSRLCDHLLEADSDYFLFRDFQSRNIMVHGNEPWFIDYQGGRRGGLQYDVASLLYDGKAALPDEFRTQLLEHYLQYAEREYQISRIRFLKYYPAFILIRILQALGAYGFRGYFERKEHFLKSIPYALDNLRGLLNQYPELSQFDHLIKILEKLVDKEDVYYHSLIELIKDMKNNTSKLQTEISSQLTLQINSFSFKKALPDDPSGNGGGFIFDCRALPNPGRYNEYKELTGKDSPVIQFLENESSVATFLEHVSGLVRQSIDNYLERGFSNLMVSFGCTGGRHRSVYCAEKLAALLSGSPTLNVKVTHIEQEQLNEP